MHEKQIESLIKKSVVETSDDFTRNVLRGLELANAQCSGAPAVRSAGYVGLVVLIGGVVLGAALLSGTLQKLLDSGDQILFNRTFFLLIFIAGLLTGINHILRLQSDMRKLQEHRKHPM